MKQMIAATVVAFATFVSLASPAGAIAPIGVDPSIDPARMIQSVIQQQLAAFNSGDRGYAFDLSSPSVQRSFETPEAFNKMVKTNFAQLHHSSAAVFLELRKLDERFVQRVQITGADGTQVVANYVMVKVNDGSWRVGGVLFDRPEEDAKAEETKANAEEPTTTAN